MSKQQHYKKDFVNGGIAGIIAKTMTSPLNIIKLQKQTNTKLNDLTKLSNYWKGNGFNCIRFFPYSGIQFSTYSFLKSKEVNPLLSGITAGALATSFTHPLDVIHFRKAVYNDNCNINKNLLKGMRSSVLSTSLFTGLHFAIYDKIKDKNNGSWWKPLIYSSQASLLSQSLCYPLDTIRRRSQLLTNGKAGIAQTALTIYIENGYKGFYNGLFLNALKVVPTQAIRFTIFELLTKTQAISSKYA
jgi:solute carrier family 25 phosphate transporter 23/24/25/41